MPRLTSFVTAAIFSLALHVASGRAAHAQSATGEDLRIGPEEPILALGLRVAGYYSPSIAKRGTMVTAVQRGGPAFFSGLLPGDLIIVLDGTPDPAPAHISRTAFRARAVSLGIEGRGPKGERSFTTVEVPVERPRKDEWITTPGTPRRDFATRRPSPEIETQRQASRAAWPQHRDSLLAEATNTTCNNWALRGDDIISDVRAYRYRLGESTVPMSLNEQLRNLGSRSCSSERYGVISDAEAALFASGRATVNPCELGTDASVRAVADSVRAQISAADYNQFFANDVLKPITRMDPSKRKCIMLFLQERLLQRQGTR